MTEEQQSSIEVDLKNQTAKLTGNDIFTIVGALATVALLVGGWFHHTRSEATVGELTSAMRDQAKATREQTVVQRERNCLEKFKPEERHAYASWCSEVSGAARGQPK